MTQTNQTLVNFIQNLPLSDKITAIKSLIIYDTQNGSFDDLMLSIAPSLDFTKISPLRLILEMGRLNDGTQNVQRFVNDSCSYLSILIQVPDLMNPNYNIDLLCRDFVAYIENYPSEMPYIQNVIRCTISNDPTSLNECFAKVLNAFYFNFNQKPQLSQCLNDLQFFYDLLCVDEIRDAFCEDFNFFPMMRSLFMKSVFPVGQGMYDFYTYFGNDDRPDQSKLSALEQVLSSYILQLKNIVLLCCRSNTQAKTFDFIRNFFLDMKHRADDQSYWMARYNFECTLMEISFMKQADWVNSDPFTPYMKKTLAPLGSEYELAVVGKYSWVDPNNLTLDEMKISYEDKDEDILNDQRAWEQKLREVSNQEAKAASNFFFATLQAIELSSVNFLNILENIGMQLHYKPNHPANRQLKQISFVIEALLCLNFKSSKIITFLHGTLKFLQKTSQYDGLKRKLPPRPPIEYQHLPEYILASCVKLVEFYNQVGLIPAANNKLFEFIQMESSLFMNKKYVRNPVIANDIVRFFANIASQPMGRGNCHLIITDTVIEEVYPAVVDFFSRVENTGTHSEYYDKMNMRRPCLLLMAFWLRHRECRNYFIRHWNDKENKDFLYHLASDLLFYLQNCFGEIAQLNESLSSEQSKKFTIEKDILSIRENLRAEFRTVKDFYNLISEIASFAPFAFTDKIAEQLANIAIGVFKEAIVPSKLLISNPQEIEYDPNFFLLSFASLFSTMIQNEEVLNYFYNISITYNDDLLGKALQAIQNLASRSNDYTVYNSFKAFVDAVNSLNVLTLPLDVIIPDELTDIVTGELLLDPYKMPSGYIYNKSTIDKLENFMDPYGCVKFKPDDPVPDLETKRKAEQFFKEHAVPSKK